MIEEIVGKEIPDKDEEKNDDVEDSVLQNNLFSEEEPPSKKLKNEPETANENEENEIQSNELAEFWRVVKENPLDFSGWTNLLQFVDYNTSIIEVRRAFDAFLHRYPYCYGYWKKYADIEKRKGSRVQEVFEAGVSAIPLSSDLWIHYLSYFKGTFQNDKKGDNAAETREENNTEENESEIRSLYERALESCGSEWRSDKLWDSYVKWEIERGTRNNVLKLYDRILSNPTQGLSHQFEMFKDFVKENHPIEVMSDEEFLEYRKEYLEYKENNTDNDDDGITSNNDDEEAEKEIENIRNSLIESRRAFLEATEEFVGPRRKFEDNIKRPYFHMKPLEKSQLKNWSEYLDFEISQGSRNFKRIQLLFERCCIATALYEDYWLKYLNWLKLTNNQESSSPQREKTAELISDVYRRACEHHLPDKIKLHLDRGLWEEKLGRFESVRRIYESLEKKHSNCLSVWLAHIHFERRVGNISTVKSLFKRSILHFSSFSSSASASELSIKYSRFLRFVNTNLSEAKAVLNEALIFDESNSKLYLNLIDIYIHSHPLPLSSILSVFEAAISKSSTPIIFSQRKIEFLTDFASELEELEKAQEAHENLLQGLSETNSERATNGSYLHEEKGSGWSEYQYTGAGASN